MKKHFEQAIAFDRDSPLNQRVGLGKKYNELVDEYNALEAKSGEVMKVTDVADEDSINDEQKTVPAQSDEAQEDQPQTNKKPAKNKRG